MPAKVTPEEFKKLKRFERRLAGFVAGVVVLALTLTACHDGEYKEFMEKPCRPFCEKHGGLFAVPHVQSGFGGNNWCVCMDGTQVPRP